MGKQVEIVSFGSGRATGARFSMFIELGLACGLDPAVHMRWQCGWDRQVDFAQDLETREAKRNGEEAHNTKYWYFKVLVMFVRQRYIPRFRSVVSCACRCMSV